MDNDQVNNVAQKVATLNMATVDAIIGLGCQGPQILSLLLSSMVASIRGIAIATGRNGEITSDSIIFATTLAGAVFNPAGNDMAMDFSVETVLEALSRFKTLTGKEPAKVLSESLVSAAQEAEEEASKAADAMLNATGIRPGKLN